LGEKRQAAGGIPHRGTAAEAGRKPIMAAEAMPMSTVELEELRQAAREIMPRYGVQLAYLHGSQATDSATPLSDIDVAILADPALTPREPRSSRPRRTDGSPAVRTRRPNPCGLRNNGARPLFRFFTSDPASPRRLFSEMPRGAEGRRSAVIDAAYGRNLTALLQAFEYLLVWRCFEEGWQSGRSHRS
jgi:hypothetical protein